MKYVAFSFVLFLFSCGSLTRKEPIQHEKGYVMAMQYKGPVDASGTSTGISSKGSLVVSDVHVTEDARFDVVFRCQHGVVFVINRKELFNKLTEKDSVDISYYELVDGDGKIRNLDFVDANKLR